MKLTQIIQTVWPNQQTRERMWQERNERWKEDWQRAQWHPLYKIFEKARREFNHIARVAHCIKWILPECPKTSEDI